MSRELLQGAIEMHVHAGPDLRPRSTQFLELGRQLAAAGFAGVVIKDHYLPTMDRAFAVNATAPPGFQAWGTVVLNRPVGGLNPGAVALGLAHGAAIVFMPTMTARNSVEKLGRPPVARLLEEDDPGLTIVDGRGKVLPEVADICRQVAEAGAILATGHVAPAECLALAEAAQAAGVQHLLATHASSHLSDLSIDQQRRFVALGGTIEHCWIAVRSAHHPVAPEQIAAQIRAVGAAHCILSTDYGQTQLGPPVDGFYEMVSTLLALGITEQEIRTMICDNPRRLLMGRSVTIVPRD